MDNNQLRQLLSQYFDNVISRADCERLLQYLDETDPAPVSGIIDEVLNQKRPTAPFAEAQRNRIYDRLMTNIEERNEPAPTEKSVPARARWWIRVAAAWVAVVSIGLLIYYTGSKSVSLPETAVGSDILLPDDTQAILTLADGQTIVLHDSMDGILASQAGIAIRRTKDGSILYEPQSMSVAEKEIPFNTFRTPKGYSHQLTLPDGTRVWLNTASSIHFPVIFNGNDRQVTLTGEAYFEVAHDASKPFRVAANGSMIHVLGTHFNVSAYSDEEHVVATVLEGAVNVSRNGSNVELKPGEQAMVDSQTGRIRQSKIDVQSVMAWKNGYFRFDNEPIESIINQVSKWYDIEKVEYRGQFDDRFTGTFQRSKSITQLFRHLERIAPITFSVEGKEVVIMK